jgi:hypothetical protein
MKTSTVWDNRNRRPGEKRTIYHACRCCRSPLLSEEVMEGYCKSCVEEINNDIDQYDRWYGECRG